MSKKVIKVANGISEGKYLSPPQTERLPLTLQKPTFRLDCCHSKKYCLGRSNDKIRLSSFAKTVHQLSQMSWHQIQYSDRRGAGAEKLNFLRPKLPNTISVPNDVDIIGIKYWRRWRLVGYKDENNAFRIVWADDGTLYGHG